MRTGMSAWPAGARIGRARSKYGARRKVVDGHNFASEGEAGRYLELKLLERANEIHRLELQPRFPCVVNGVEVCTYIADFRYRDRRPTLKGGASSELVVEDFKGFDTPAGRLRRKLAEALHGIQVRIIRKGKTR